MPGAGDALPAPGITRRLVDQPPAWTAALAPSRSVSAGSRILVKPGLRGRAQAAVFAYESGLARLSGY
ncbi:MULTISPECIES: hypothetical protein [unclassified Streptomyces]|uniref:hypothetical protein n=1 Tax=unclassified Streptomyces TaxID=2593676 RepID=UPI0022555C77|nr:MULTISPECIES: hypothetical protein [unclassified Streptomyces]MCX4882391.1 hypothetical protein [Streptomyces sp. NBC_00847]MCX5422421.1 hypothetical protein [Streptomyces sp. NBC_00078]